MRVDPDSDRIPTPIFSLPNALAPQQSFCVAFAAQCAHLGQRPCCPLIGAYCVVFNSQVLRTASVKKEAKAGGKKSGKKGGKKGGQGFPMQGFPFFLSFFLYEIVPRTQRTYSCGSREFLEDRMMDIITGRAPPPGLSSGHGRQTSGYQGRV